VKEHRGQAGEHHCDPTRLPRRSTRSLALTDAGELFYRQARTTGEVMRGELRVSLPPVNDESLLAMIASFAKEHPGVRMQVDFSTRIVDLLREGYDVALRAAIDIQPGLVVRSLP
jgi:DNA-binding transcriptional LysR family regulator